MSLKIYITVLKRKTSLDVILKHKTPSSFSGLATARAEINSSRALPVIARAWLRHCPLLPLLQPPSSRPDYCYNSSCSCFYAGLPTTRLSCLDRDLCAAALNMTTSLVICATSCAGSPLGSELNIGYINIRLLEKRADTPQFLNTKLSQPYF